jgi:hypothetical protein
MADDFETRFNAQLEEMAAWVGGRHDRSANRYAEFGEQDVEVHVMLQRTHLLAELIGATGDALAKGVHLKQISVPEAKRRRRYATRVLDRLLAAARAAGLTYVFVESVLSDELHILMCGRAEFVAAPHMPNCYVAKLL